MIAGMAQEVKRIISLVPSISRNIYSLDQQSKLVGCTNYCSQAMADHIPEVASSVSVNLEKVITLKPDLVLASPLTKIETIEKLKSIGIRVEYFNIPSSFEDICEQFIQLGSLIGVEQEAIEIVDQQRAKLKQLKSKIEKRDNKLSMFMQIGAKPLWGVIPNTFLDDYITFIGGENVASDLSHGAISREHIIIKNPEVIFLVTMGNFGEEEKENWKKHKSLSAVKNNRIYIINSDLACEPTPLAFIKTLEQMINLINNLN
jgi:ABC-type Fe3+-hydroxamate transport system substrate-binding protein